MKTTWMGVPLNEIPREELEREFAIAYRQIRMLEGRVSDLTVENMKLLAGQLKDKSYGISAVQSSHPGLVDKILNLFFRRN
jgi:hypothetical protein